MADWRAQAAAHRNAGRYAQAIDCFQHCLTETPNDVTARHDLGLLLLMTGRAGEAIAILTEASRLAPQWDALFRLLGEARMQSGDAQGAVRDFGQAAALAPKDADIRVRLGIALAAVGRSSDAVDAYDAAIGLDPSHIAAYYNRSGLKKYVKDDPEILLLTSMVPGLSVSDQILVHFILGKAWMDVGDADQAFAHFHRGNALHRATLSYDVADDIARMGKIAEQFTQELIQKFSGQGVLSQQPIFIVGMPRSGSTLVEQILASHPMVEGAGEIAAFRAVLGRITGADGVSLPYPDLMALMPPQAVATVGDLYLKLVGPYSHGKPRLVDKFLENSLYAGLIHLALPNARIIHCRRDPVDTCLSCYTLLFGTEQHFTYDMSELGRYWRAHDALMEHWRTVLPADRFIEIEYEQVVAELETQVRRLLDFLDLPWEPACMAFHKTERTVMTASNAQVRRPIHGGSVGRWKPYAAQIQPLLQALGVNIV